MKTYRQDAAFASPCSSYDGHDIPGSDGLTKREYFTGQALIGLLANNVYHNPNEKNKMIQVGALAETAVKYADAVIDALSK